MGKLDSMLDELNIWKTSITLRDENGEEVKLYVLEETKLNASPICWQVIRRTAMESAIC